MVSGNPIGKPTAKASPAGAAAAYASGVRLMVLALAVPAVIAALVSSLPTSLAAVRSVAYPRPVVSIIIASLARDGVRVGAPIRFIAQVKVGLDLTYTWQFGDGVKAAGAQVTHAFARYSTSTRGEYSVTLTVQDAVGQRAATETQLNVLPIMPRAVFTDSIQQFTVTFDGRRSTGTGLRYAWTFGDGTALSGGAVVRHSYQQPGSYKADLTVVDVAGQKDHYSTPVFVGTPPPTAVIDVTNTSTTSSSTCYDFNAGRSSGYELLYSWNLGDGSSTHGVDVRHCYVTGSGTYLISLQVTDAFGQTAAANAEVIA